MTANTFNLSESKDNGDGKSIFAFKSIHSSHVANSNCQAWNICTGAAPDTDRAGAEDDDDLGSVAAAARDKTVTRVASDELASRTDEADNGTVFGGRCCTWWWTIAPGEGRFPEPETGVSTNI